MPDLELDDDTRLDDEVATSQPEPTGVAQVDTVMNAVAGLGDAPLEEHVATYEAAHAELRRTLDDPA